MIIIGLLVWVGVRLEAPTAFYILPGIDAMIKILTVGVKLGEKNE